MSKVKKQKKVMSITDVVNHITADCQYNYISHNTIKTNCNGTCDDYCRCSEITGIDIEEIYYNDIAKDILSKFGIDNSSLLYALEKYIKSNVSKDNFDWSSRGGYYGEELDYIKLDRDKAEQIVGFCVNNIESNQEDLLKTGLTLEHGYLAKQYENFFVEHKTLKCKDLLAKVKLSNLTPNIKTIQRIMHSGEYNGVILEEVNGIYKLIDGNHRVQALANIINKNTYYNAKIFSQREITALSKKRIYKNIYVTFLIKEDDPVVRLTKRVKELEKRIETMQSDLNRHYENHRDEILY